MVEKELDTKTLNEKLLKWVGFVFHPETKNFLSYYTLENGIYNPPDLVNSLDAQAKWIYPKLRTLNIFVFKDHANYSPSFVKLISSTAPIDINVKAETESVAFALAVEKLIDSIKIGE